MALSGCGRRSAQVVLVAAIGVLVQTAASMAAPVPAESQGGAPAITRSMPDGIYVGNSRAADDLISYRLQVTIADHQIAAADFQELWDGFPFTPGEDAYNKQWLVDPVRRPAYLAKEPTFVAQAAAAQEYDSRLVGLTDVGQIPPPAENVQVYDALLKAWANLARTRLKIVQHVNQAVGDNGNAPHTWNEYLPLAVREQPRRRVPLVLVLHGLTNNIVQAEGLGFPFLGAAEDFITLIPDDSNNGNTYGPDGGWNVTPSLGSTQLSDVDFLLALIRYEERTRAINPTRIYITGISNGAAMSSYLAMLHPDVFAGVAALAGCIGSTGGSYNETFVSQVNALLARDPSPGLPVVTGAGDEDQFTWLTPLRGQGPYSTAGPGYRTQISWWKAYNRIPQVTWDPQDPWGQPLEDNDTVTRYGYVIDTGQLHASDGPALLSFYTVRQMFHLDPNPYADVLSWNFLSRFRRLPDGHIIEMPR
jgi:poly(3-hydroxybutyrate) depolymerase